MTEKENKSVVQIENQVDDMFKIRSRENLSLSFITYDLTKCPLRLFYNITSENSYKKEANYKEKINCKFLIDKWCAIFMAAKIDVVSKNVSVGDNFYRIVGNINFLIRFDGMTVPVNVYSVKNEEFNSVVKNGALRKHMVGFCTDLWLAERNDGIIIYENRETLEYKFIFIENKKEIINSVKKICKNVIDAISYKDIPDKPYKEMSAECVSCEFLKKCWETK